MGIYIPNMELPTGNAKVTIEISADGLLVERETGTGNRYLGPRIYHAIHVQDHGRLVDAQSIRDIIIQKWMDKADDSYMYKRGMEDAYEVIRNAPTIIPAEEGRR